MCVKPVTGKLHTILEVWLCKILSFWSGHTYNYIEQMGSCCMQQFYAYGDNAMKLPLHDIAIDLRNIPSGLFTQQSLVWDKFSSCLAPNVAHESAPFTQPLITKLNLS